MICYKCKEDKNISEFDRDSSRPNGYSSACKKCKRLYNKKYYINNKDEELLRNKEWSKINRDKINISAKKRYDKDPKYFSLKNKLSHERNKEKRLVNKKVYYENNKAKFILKAKIRDKRLPHKKAERCRRRRAQKQLVNENFTSKQMKFILYVFNNQCFNCGSKNNLCVDHFKPLSKGNPLTLENAIILCIKCNSSKHTKDPQDFFLSHKFNRAKSLMRDAQRVYDKVA